VACLSALLGACGDSSSSPPSDREQIEGTVLGFFRDVVDGDTEAACDKLTGAGRAVAVGRTSLIGHLPRPVSRERCVEGPLELRDSTELPGLVENDLIRVTRVRIHGERARAYTKAGYYDGVQRLRRTSRGWRIDLYDAMVHH
jgi:hypothetical protein